MFKYFTFSKDKDSQNAQNGKMFNIINMSKILNMIGLDKIAKEIRRVQKRAKEIRRQEKQEQQTIRLMLGLLDLHPRLLLVFGLV